VQSFRFQAKTKVLYGVGAAEGVAQEAVTLGANRVLVVTDPGIVQAGLLEKVTDSLSAAELAFEVFDEIEPNPRDATILQGAEVMKEFQAEAVVALGGGSPIDAAKAIAVMAANEGPIELYCGTGVDPWPVTPAPIIAIPTTAGTGAEVSGAAMINLVSQSRKVDMFGRSIQPATAILDPLLTVGLSPRLTAWTGVDALSHALEAYVAKYANPFTDTLAERAIELVVDNLRTAFANGEDLEARGKMLIASTMAVMAAGAGLGVVHSLAQTIGGYYDAPHGLSIAVCFPVGVEYNLFAAPEKHARVSQILGTDIGGLSLPAAAKSVVPALRELLEDVGIPLDMRALGVQEADIPKLAEICMLDGCTSTNPRPIDAQGFVDLFERALSGANNLPRSLVGGRNRHWTPRMCAPRRWTV